EKIDWLRYQHLIVERSNVHPQPANSAASGSGYEPKPTLIKNFMGYNTGETTVGGGSRSETNWVPDLLVEGTVQVDAPQGHLILELSKGADVFQARFDLKAGTCSLWRLADGTPEQELGRANNVIAKSGSYKLRFANFDNRLTLWVDGKLPFGDGVAYDGPL